jgi:hypothetical protein
MRSCSNWPFGKDLSDSVHNVIVALCVRRLCGMADGNDKIMVKLAHAVLCPMQGSGELEEMVDKNTVFHMHSLPVKPIFARALVESQPGGFKGVIQSHWNALASSLPAVQGNTATRRKTMSSKQSQSLGKLISPPRFNLDNVDRITRDSICSCQPT